MIDGKSILDQLLGAVGGQGGAQGGQGRGGLGDLSRMSESLGSGGGRPAPGGQGGGQQGGGGGLGDLIGGMLGGGSGGGSQSPGGPGGLGDMLGKVTDYAKQNPGLSTAAAGGLAAVLFGGRGPKLKADALTLGGLAAIGTLAYKAFQQYKLNNPDVPAPAPSSTPIGTPAALPPADSPFHPANAPGGQDAVALSIVTAMIAAAKADGTVDAEERQKILGRLSEGGMSSEEREYLDRELAGPLDIDKVVNSATGPEHAIELYAASLLAINPDQPAERAYLDMLAARLGLDADLKSSIEKTVATAGA